MRRIVALTALVIAGFAHGASAQSQAAIGLGLAITSNDPPTLRGVGTTSIGPLIRIKTGEGFGPTIGFDWYSVGVQVPVNGSNVFLGDISVKPVMAGVAYTRHYGNFWVSGSVVGGYAFTKLDVHDPSRPAIRSGIGASYLSFATHGGPVTRPQLGMWYDAGPRVGVTASIAYMFVAPKAVIASDRGAYLAPLDAKCWVLTFGMVYGVF